MIKKDRRGFTLLEMLVVSAIFVMALTAMVAIFVQTNRVQKILANSEKLQADTRYVVELIAREIRNNRIYYGFYDNIPGSGKNLSEQPVKYLALRDNDNKQIIFYYDHDLQKIKICRDISDTINCANNDYYNVTPDDISVTSMKFFITPNSDPFIVYDADRSNEQPLVTIALTTQPRTDDVDAPDWIRYQTAISSRYYIR